MRRAVGMESVHFGLALTRNCISADDGCSREPGNGARRLPDERVAHPATVEHLAVSVGYTALRMKEVYYAAPAQAGAGPGKTAPVWSWYVAYAVCMALLYLLTAIMGAAYLAGAGFLAIEQADLALMGIYGVFMLGLGIVFTALYGAAPFLPKKHWAWVYHLVMICIGLTSCCCLPVCIPLLIYWLKPETKAMFGAGPQPGPPQPPPVDENRFG